jgi:excisionase family DNA binding protein
MTEYTPRSSAAEPELLDVLTLAAMLDCSTRHVERLSDAGKMPPALKIGRLRRWSRRSIREWLDAGCPSCRQRRAAR